jgi:ribonuclease R
MARHKKKNKKKSGGNFSDTPSGKMPDGHARPDKSAKPAAQSAGRKKPYGHQFSQRRDTPEPESKERPNRHRGPGRKAEAAPDKPTGRKKPYGHQFSERRDEDSRPSDRPARRTESRPEMSAKERKSSQPRTYKPKDTDGKPFHKEKPPRRKHGPGRTSDHKPGHMPDVAVLLISGETEDGELIAEPVKWSAKYRPPHIVVIESGHQQAAIKGDRIMAKMRKINPNLYQALLIRILPGERPLNVLGVFVPTADGGIIEPISRKMKESFMVARGDTHDAVHGELVSGVTLPGVPSLGMSYARITERLGRLDAPRAASLIASHMHDLPSVFPPEALEEAAAAPLPVLTADRVDLRQIPLVTIDGEDARDFDDAVFAERDGNGWHLVVAIADVAFYVEEDSALDASAFERGNSVYFPDRVIPMLPERLSNGLCSLNPDEDRYCLAVHLWIDAQGHMQRYQFVRGLMRSRARLTYNEVQSAFNAKAGHPLLPSIIAPLYAAYDALAAERDARGALDLNLPEFKIHFDASGNVSQIAPRERLESHRLIEVFMIAANVAAADFLLKQKIPGIYRVHEPPAEEKLTELQNLLKMAGYSLHVGAGIKAGHFNRVLKQSAGQPEAFLVNTAVLRSQMQAYYSHENLGHFGLSLQKYCHFTSPIRRYSDLVVHRSLAQAIEGHAARATKQTNARLAEVALHISDTERRAMLAERDASDRYKVAYMSHHIGSSFSGTVVSLNEYGLFVSLNDTGVTGFIPVRNLQGDFFNYDKRHACFKGQRTNQVFQIGQPLIIRVQTANAITGSLIFELAANSSAPDRPLRDKHSRHKDQRGGYKGGHKDSHKKRHKDRFRQRDMD